MGGVVIFGYGVFVQFVCFVGECIDVGEVVVMVDVGVYCVWVNVVVGVEFIVVLYGMFGMLVCFGLVFGVEFYIIVVRLGWIVGVEFYFVQVVLVVILQVYQFVEQVGVYYLQYCYYIVVVIYVFQQYVWCVGVELGFEYVLVVFQGDVGDYFVVDCDFGLYCGDGYWCVVFLWGCDDYIVQVMLFQQMFLGVYVVVLVVGFWCRFVCFCYYFYGMVEYDWFDVVQCDYFYVVVVYQFFQQDLIVYVGVDYFQVYFVIVCLCWCLWQQVGGCYGGIGQNEFFMLYEKFFLKDCVGRYWCGGNVRICS